MVNLTAKEQERAIRKATLLWHLRHNAGASLEQIARRLEYGSVEAMRTQFENWGLPTWIVGEAEAEEEQRENERRARTTNEKPVELPPAHNAAPLFHRALTKLGWAVGDLENRKEYLQNGRFVTQEAAGSMDWPEMGVEGGTVTLPLGAHQTPLDPLPALVATYILSGEPLEPLLQTLHLNPQTVDMGQVQSLIEGERTPSGHKRGLKSVAGMIARGVRGGKIRGGRTTGEFSPRVQNGVWYSRQLCERGVDHATISERLKEAGFTQTEISQIRSLSETPLPQ
jgi:hypothetical protein